MGTRNRQRRAEKHRRRDRASARRSDRFGAPPSFRDVICAAVELSWDEAHKALFAEVVEALAAADLRQVALEVEAMIAEAMEGARRGNWERAEVVRQVERRHGTGHVGYVESRGRPLRAAEDLAAAIRVLGLLWRLPPLPTFGAPGRRRSGDSQLLQKVRALLAKAESTTFPEEAEALSAKAQELMARHSIDAAMVDVGEERHAEPSGRRIAIDDPYAGPKSVLLLVVASANRCRAVWSKHLGFSTVVGYEHDLEFVELLYTSLLVQATSAMAAAGPRVDRYGRSRTRSFRQSFLLAYAGRIGDRLQAAEAAGREDAADEYGDALLPVLARRSDAVDNACADAFPGAVDKAVTITNAAGWAAGTAAADLATLSGRAEVARPA